MTASVSLKRGDILERNVGDPRCDETLSALENDAVRDVKASGFAPLP